MSFFDTQSRAFSIHSVEKHSGHPGDLTGIIQAHPGQFCDNSSLEGKDKNHFPASSQAKCKMWASGPITLFSFSSSSKKINRVFIS